MKSDSLPLPLARFLFTIVLVAAFLWLPGIYLLIGAIIGALFFPYYIEGAVLVWCLELLVKTPEVAGWQTFFWGTLAVVVAIIAGHFIRQRLMGYN